MAARKNPSSDKGYPRGKVGGYGAPVDTTGMSQSDKESFGFGSKTAPRPARGAFKFPDLGGAVSAIKKAVTPRTQATPKEDAEYKRRGEMAYYKGKIERNRKK